MDDSTTRDAAQGPETAPKRSPGVPAEYVDWLNAGEWRLEVGVPLVLMASDAEFNKESNWSLFEPVALRTPEGQVVRDGYLRQFSHWIAMAVKAVTIGTLLTSDADEQRQVALSVNHGEIRVLPGDLVEWFEGEGFRLPTELVRLMQGERATGSLVLSHPALDKSHRYYAEELDIAIRAWEALYGKCPSEALSPDHNGHKPLIRKWIKDRFSATKARRERIAVVLNPHKSPGAPPTRSRKLKKIGSGK
jgi:hypothetical protein